MTNLITATHKQIGALITEGMRGLAKVDKALEKAQQKHGATHVSFNQELANAGAISTDFLKGTASSPEVFYFYKECVARSLPVAKQKVLAGKGGDEKRKIIMEIGGRMGTMKKALERRESLKAGTATDKRTKAAKAAKAKTAGGKGTDTPAPNMAPESGEVPEAKGILPPAIRDPQLTEIFNKAAQMDIVEQAQLATLINRAMQILAKAK
jgi:hypothetical protein